MVWLILNDREMHLLIYICICDVTIIYELRIFWLLQGPNNIHKIATRSGENDKSPDSDVGLLPMGGKHNCSVDQLM